MRNIAQSIGEISDEVAAQAKRVQIRQEELWVDSIKRLAIASISPHAPHNPHNLEKDEPLPRVNAVSSRNQATIRAAKSARHLFSRMIDTVAKMQSLPYVTELEAMSRSLLTR